MSVARTAITISVLGLAGLGLWYGLEQRRTPQETATPVAGSAASRARITTAPDAKAASRRPTGPHARPAGSAATDYGKAFRESTNYRSFVLAALPAARAGDRDAQYYLHAALAYCDETYKFYFRRANKVLSVDEAIEDRSDLSGPSMTEAIQRAYRRCHEINETKNPDWGTMAEWLAKATDAGQPLAQMETAQKIFLRPLVHGGIAAQSQTPAIAQGTYTEARSLVRAAIETKDPQVIFDIGDLQGFLQKDQPQDQLAKNAVTWRYVACLRGLDCGVDAEWHLQFCLWDSNCLPGESGVDYLRRIAPTLNVIDLEQRAYDLNAKIDAGSWDELGLGS